MTFVDDGDSIPESLHLATDRDATKIRDERIVQHFLPNGTIGIGVVPFRYVNADISRIFDKERLLIETARNKTKLPYDADAKIAHDIVLKAIEAAGFHDKVNHCTRAFMIHGHIHGNTNADYWPYLQSHESILNASVEVNDHAPMTFDELVANNRKFKAAHQEIALR